MNMDTLKFAASIAAIGFGIVLAVAAFFPIGHKQDRHE